MYGVFLFFYVVDSAFSFEFTHHTLYPILVKDLLFSSCVHFCGMA